MQKKKNILILSKSLKCPARAPSVSAWPPAPQSRGSQSQPSLSAGILAESLVKKTNAASLFSWPSHSVLITIRASALSRVVLGTAGDSSARGTFATTPASVFRQHLPPVSSCIGARSEVSRCSLQDTGLHTQTQGLQFHPVDLKGKKKCLENKCPGFQHVFVGGRFCRDFVIVVF